MSLKKSHPRTRIALMLPLFLLAILSQAVESDQQRQSSPSRTTSLHDTLTSNGLPVGLFPKGISDFSFDPATGHFELRLASPTPCDTKFETRVRYDCNITGSLSYGKIAGLSGVAAQELFLWLPVNGIQVDVPSSGLIYFDAGGVSKQFSLSSFENPHDCDVEAGDGNAGEGIKDIVMNESGEIVRLEAMDHEGRADS